MRISNFPFRLSALAKAGVFALAVCASGMAAAGVLTFNDTTVGSSLCNRPVANGALPPVAPLSGVGTAVPHDVTHFQVNQNDAYSFLVTATNPAAWDNYAFLYQASFNPAAPFSNVIIGNDDFPNIGVSGFNGVNLSAGVDYFLVITGFGNSDAGAYEARIEGRTGTAFLPQGGTVPEPGSLALAGLALFGLAAARRKAQR